MSEQAFLTVELPVGTQHMVIGRDEFIRFITDCYLRGLSAFAHLPAARSNGS
jgi:hypothetical protein